MQIHHKNNYKLKLSDLAEELPKAEVLVKMGLCDIYILVTNAGVSGPVHEKIQKKLMAVGINDVLVFGADWLFQKIRENKRLRRLVPRVYGLGDLSQILDERVYAQGRTLLESLKEDLGKVVITGAYQKAAEALDKHSFVLLIGEPAAGKTTIASLLAMGALDQWKASTLKLETAGQVIDHWNPDDPFQFFWIDDAFGVTQYERSLVHEWNHRMVQIKAMLKNGSKIVMTSRDYMYNHARNDLKEGTFPLLKESQVVIDVHNLTISEKRQMLYNHIKMGDQPLKFRKEIKPFLEHIAQLHRFIPETARRVASPFFTKNLYLTEWHLKEFVNRQESFLIEVLGGLDENSKAALALIYMNNDKLPSPMELKSHELDAIERMGSSLGGCTSALDAMKGNLVQFYHPDDESYWKFKHPTVGDAFSTYVAASPELIEIYLQGSPVEKLLDQVTCGNMKIEKAIIVPKAFFRLMLNRIKSFTSTKKYKSQFLSAWGAKRQVHEFLSSRCSKEFLTQYIQVNPEIVNQVARPGLMLDSVSEVNLAYTLHHHHLLPEEQRKLFIKSVSSYAIKGEDLYALKSDKIRSIFKKEEIDGLKESLEIELIPKISSLTQTRQNAFTESDNAEDYMQPLMELYEIIEEEFEDNPTVISAVEHEINLVRDWIEENKTENKVAEREKLANESNSPWSDDERSIFDDIDIV